MELKKLVLLPLVMSIFACSSGDDETSTTPSSPVTVSLSAVNGFTQPEQTEVSLSGTASTTNADATIAFAWTVSDASIVITHPDTTVADATFTTPEVRTNDSQVTLTLTATDSTGSSNSAAQVMTIQVVNEDPDVSVAASQDSRFDENTYGGALTVTLTATGSDADPIDAAAPISSYAWEQTSGTDITAGLTLDQATLTLTTPALNISEEMEFEVTVTDNEGATDSESVTITVLDVTQTPPVADAGNPITIMEGERFLLAGSATSLTTSAEPFLFEWTNTSAELAEFADASDETTYADAPAVTANTDITIDLRVVDQFNNEDNDQVVVTVRDLPVSRMNDTGITTNYSDNAQVNGASHDYPGQDADLGRDRIAASDVIEKAGEGDAGFDYTKLDVFGDGIDFSETSWSCVRDNVTGLVWEVKTTDSGLQDFNHTYSWVDDTANSVNDGASCSITNCDTASYIAAVNANGLCGFFDWRLPTHNELMSIMDYGNADGAYVDSAFFPNNSPDTTTATWYWTSVQNSDGTDGSTIQNSWAINFSSGNDNFLLKSREHYIRLVRAGR